MNAQPELRDYLLEILPVNVDVDEVIKAFTRYSRDYMSWALSGLDLVRLEKGE